MDNKQYYKFIGFWRRFFAALIDQLVMFVGLGYVISLLFQNITGKPHTFDLNNPSLWIALLYIIYNILAIYFYGQTLGKKLFNIRVVNKDFGKLTLGQAILRELIGKFVSIIVFQLGYLWVAIDEKKQGWHDKIASTYVIGMNPISKDEYDTQGQKRASILPILLIVFGILESVWSIGFYFTTSQLGTLYKSLSVNFFSAIIYTFLFLFGGIAIIQIVYGIRMKMKQDMQTNNFLPKLLFIGGILLFFISAPLLLIASVSPLYNMTNSSKGGRNVADIKTQIYIDKNYPITFEYPTGWFMKIQSDGSGEVFANYNPLYYISITNGQFDSLNAMKNAHPLCSFSIYLYDNPTSSDIKTWYATTQVSQTTKPRSTKEAFLQELEKTYSTTTIHGVPAISLFGGSTFIAKGNKVYRLNPGLEPIGDSLCKTANSLIINSFKFTN